MTHVVIPSSPVLSSLPPPSDREALEQRLQECEHNLEVAAQMGLALISRNNLLEKDAVRLSESLNAAESQLFQLRHDLAMKDSLLQQCLQDAVEAQQEEPSLPAWVQALSEENARLKIANQQLWLENVQLQEEAQQMVEKERALVQQCFNQFCKDICMYTIHLLCHWDTFSSTAEAKLELSEIHSDMEERGRELEQMRSERDQTLVEREQLYTSQCHLRVENDELREQLAESQVTVNQLSLEVRRVGWVVGEEGGVGGW